MKRRIVMMTCAFMIIGNAAAENIAVFGTAAMEPGPGWGHVAHHAVDGDMATLAQSATPVWDLKVDLGMNYPVGSVRVHSSEGGWANAYSIKVSTDNKNWTTVSDVTQSSHQMKVVEFDEVKARYVWMDVTGVAHDGNFGHGIYEFEVFVTKSYKPVSFDKQGLKMKLSPIGSIRSLVLPSNSDEIQFRAGGYHSGPSWLANGKKVKLTQKDPDKLLFNGKQGDVAYSIEYKKDGNKLAVIAGLKNEGQKTFKPDAARLMLGLNTEMIKYPDWNDKFFPTLIRGEKTHLWGYFMSPKGRIVTISSPDPIASWNYEFQPGRHRIYTVSLDMLHKLPLPERHPQDLTELQPGEEKTWTIFLQEVDSLADVKPVVSSNVNAPMIDIDRYTIADGEQSVVSVISGETVRLTVTDPEGNTSTVKPRKDRSAELYHYSLKPKSGIGQYTLRAKNKSGKITEASVYVRHPWSWYIKQARKEAIRIPQKASTHTESWLGHYATMAARRYFPDEKMDTLAEENFRTILPLMYDVKTGDQIVHTGRIQNSYYMFGLLADIYKTTGDEQDLELASKIADWLMKYQAPDGAYRTGNTHYTCVAYGAKSMLELAAAEKELAKTSDVWRERYDRHYKSAKAAIEELELNLDNIQTEGQATYEDGMISCSATQLAMWALLQDDSDQRAKFLKAATDMFDGHRCLDQMIVPDSRYHEGTLRFWEAQYDVMIPRNMMNSPHGWTAWRIPGYYYMYQLTGEEEWLRRAMNSLGSCVQLIDGETGILRHSFTQDPYIETTKLVEDEANPDNNSGIRVPTIIGEQYQDMISHFYKPKDFNKVYGGHWGEAGNCDNDVHEIFKALEEVALTAAYVIERADGTLSTYNCKAKKTGTAITIIPAEEVVSRVHLNLKKRRTVKVNFCSGEKVSGNYTGMQWIGPGGVPEDFQ
ncbi:MAG: discoidin domain-containing protein [Planctomycetota bacterium]